jgi:ribonuclease G
MSKEMVISTNPHETRVAILEEGQLCEYYVEREREFALVGSIYKGRVTRVLPGMQSAFVDIGLDSDAFLYVSDFLEEIEEFDHIAMTVEDKVQKMEDQGGRVFAANDARAPAVEPADVESAPALPIAFGPPENGAVAEASTLEEASSVPRTIPPPANDVRSQDHERFENRSRQGRDFGRRGGRRGGRQGRRGGGGRGDDRRYGRELPPSKYAAPHSYEDRSGEPSAPGDSVPVILPGESLAKYKDRASSVPASLADDVFSSEATAVMPVPVEETPAPPSELRSATTAGLDPLPGETLSKWQLREPVVEERLDSAGVPVLPLGQPHQEVPVLPATQEPEAVQEEPLAPELSEDEAATLAAHVIEAQVEEAERVEQRVTLEAEEAGEAEGAELEDVSTETGEDEGVREHASSESEAEADEETETELATETEGLETLSAEPESGEEAEIEGTPPENGSPAGTESIQTEDQQLSAARVHNDFRARMQHPVRRGRDRDRGRRDHRGRRPQHGYGGHAYHRPQQHRPQLIADLLKQGQEIIVQIAKEPLGKKGARITSHIALPGRYLVYMPTLDHIGVSRKISSAEDRTRLRHLVNEAKGSAGGGFIVRTAAVNATPEEVRNDVIFLMRTWSEIKSRSEQRKAPSLLHRDLNLVERVLRDYITTDFTAIWVDSEGEYTKVVDFMGRFQPQLVNRVKLYIKDTPVFEEFGIQQEIDKGLRPKVWLKSGGYIVINHTEALVAIDVNTGKFVGKGSNRLEDTIVRTNLEAVKEIVRQMRLRDLGGIIVIDFIDMEERRNREKVMAALEDALRADRAPSKVLRFNEFGLVAITRKRTKQALERTLCQPCPYCTGSGMVKSIPTLCYEIQTEARKMAPEIDSGTLTLRVHPEVSKALKTREATLVEELEQWTKKSIIIQADPTLHWEQYDIY